MKADRLSLTIKTAYGAESILVVSHQRSSLVAHTSGSSIGLTYSSLAGLQAMELATMKHDRHDIPEPGTGGLTCTTDRGRQHPSIDGMALEGLLTFAFRLLEVVLLPQGFGLPPFSQVNGQARLSQEAIQVFFSNLHRTEGPVPLASPARPHQGLDILDDHLRKRQDSEQLLDDACFGLPSTPR
jgi:hypothetical protein